MRRLGTWVRGGAPRRYGWLACAFVLGGLSVAALLLPLLHKRVTLRVVARDIGDIVHVADHRVDDGAPMIDFWGDSLTEGKAVTPGHDFPRLIGYLFHRLTVNRGVGGETSRQIKVRMLSRDIRPGPEWAVIWAGRNDSLDDIASTEANIDGMVQSLHPGSRFLVLAVLNADTVRERRGGDRYRAIVDLNRALQARYGKNFVPIRDILVAAGNRNDPDDDEAADADTVPPSLRLDALHLNDQGEAIVAFAVEAAIRSNGW